jgi:hypothetical protein
MDTIINYVLPNVALFGSIYLVAKFVENTAWDYISNYEQYQKQLLEFSKKFK